MASKDDIKLFVKETLGCTCPDEVFEQIDCTANVKLSGGIELDYRINIGDRLLIYMVDIDRLDSLDAALPQLIKAGTRERDDDALNRFRLVLLIQNPVRIAKKVSNLNSIKTDDRAHLHIIRKDEVPF